MQRFYRVWTEWSQSLAEGYEGAVWSFFSSKKLRSWQNSVEHDIHIWGMVYLWRQCFVMWKSRMRWPEKKFAAAHQGTLLSCNMKSSLPDWALAYNYLFLFAFLTELYSTFILDCSPPHFYPALCALFLQKTHLRDYLYAGWSSIVHDFLIQSCFCELYCMAKRLWDVFLFQLFFHPW